MADKISDDPASERQEAASERAPTAERNVEDKPLEGDAEAALQDPQTYEAYQEAMGDLADGDEAASMGGPAV